MNFKQFYLGCLAHASYYVGSENEAVIIDPQRDIQQYLEESESHNQQIKYIIETHSHADFVSGHLELAKKTGAEIIYGQRAKTEFPTHKVADGDQLNIGKIKLIFFETPGHTPEGICILAETTGETAKLFTGDTLFIGDVGRPDLIGSKGFTAEQMGGMLYDSLHEKILNLPDETEIYPAHGAGSLCGKSLSKETWSTLGQQRKTNYALQPMKKDEFIKIVSADQPEVPAYFPKSASTNLKGASALEELAKPVEMSAEDVKSFTGIILDIRTATEFGAGHIPKALNIGLGGQFASWAGTLISIGTPIIIAADTQSQVDESFMRLSRIGIETVKGFIFLKNWTFETAEIKQISVMEINKILSENNNIQFVDVRRAAEYINGHAPQTLNMPLDKLTKETGKLDKSRPAYLICQGGYRSSAGTSLLERAGFEKIYNITGGTAAWIEAELKTEKAEILRAV